MEHLSAETLARLADEQPASAEKGHLAGCQACSAELDALREQAEACRHLPTLRVPLGDWEALQARLVSEGLIGSRTSLTGGLAVTPGWMRALAALVLFLAGTGVGMGVARRGTAAETAPEAAALALASGPTTAGEAAELVRITERQYMDALQRYRQLAELETGEGTGSDPATRYAALEYLVAAGQAAVRQAPTDPFLNGLLASALAERQAVLRRISQGSADNWF